MTKMSKQVTSAAAVLTGALVLGACTAGTNAGDGESRTLSLPHVFPESSAVHEAATTMQDRAPEVTDGRVEFEVYSNSQLGGDEELGTSLVNGDVECAFFAAAPSGLDDRLQLSFLPYIASSYEEADALYFNPDGVLQTNDREVLEEVGITALGFYENDFRGLTNSSRAIESPEDVAGLKIRVPGMPMYVDLFSSWGAQPVAVPFPELYTSLQQGTVDGQDNGIVLSENSGFQEVQDHLTLTRHGYGTGQMVCNTDVWESLEEDDQDALRQLAEEVSADATESVRESVAEKTAELEEAGVQITELNDDQLAEFAANRDEVWDSMEDTFGRDTLDALRAEIEEVTGE